MVLDFQGAAMKIEYFCGVCGSVGLFFFPLVILIVYSHSILSGKNCQVSVNPGVTRYVDYLSAWFAEVWLL